MSEYLVDILFIENYTLNFKAAVLNRPSHPCICFFFAIHTYIHTVHLWAECFLRAQPSGAIRGSVSWPVQHADWGLGLNHRPCVCGERQRKLIGGPVWVNICSASRKPDHQQIQYDFLNIISDLTGDCLSPWSEESTIEVWYLTL